MTWERDTPPGLAGREQRRNKERKDGLAGKRGPVCEELHNPDTILLDFSAAGSKIPNAQINQS